MILERVCSLKPGEVEGSLRRAARRRRASISAAEPAGAGMVFAVLQPDLYAKLLAADLRFAAFLPCRIASYSDAGPVHLVSASPVEFCHSLGRQDLEGLAGAAEALLNDIMEEAARYAAMAAGSGAESTTAWGSTEDQVNMRGALAQRIDNRGSKLEELAGTGEHDSHGG